MKLNLPRILAITLLFAATVLAWGIPSATAADIFDKNEGIDKNFTQDNMWDGEVAPTELDRAVINNTLTGEYAYLSTSHTSQNLTLGKTSIDEGRMEIRSGGHLTLVGAATGAGRVVMLGEGGLGELDLLTGSALTVIDGDIRVGSATGSSGEVTHANDATLEVGGNLTIATSANSEGTYTMSGGTMNLRDFLIVGRQGIGTLHQTAGEITINRGTEETPAIDPGLYIGSHAGGTAEYVISGGSLNVAGVNGGFRIGAPAGDNAAAFRVVGDAASIAVASHFALNPSAVLSFQAATGVSTLEVAGNLTLAGDLQMTFASSPTLGAEFTLINYGGSLTGHFDGINPFVSFSGVPFVISYGKGFDSSVRAAVVPASILAGDFNLDNKIDAADYDLLLASFNAGVLDASVWAGYQLGDINFDTVVDYTDAQLFRTAFDTANGSGAFAAMIAGAQVPEPATIWVFAAAGLGLVLRRRRLGLLLLTAVFAIGFSEKSDAQITYIDAVNGVNTFDRNGEPISTTTAGPAATDGVWDFREDLGNGGNAWQSFYGEKVDILKLTMDHIDPTYTYNVYAHFWSNASQNWRVGGTLDPANIDDNGTPEDPSDDFLPAVAGVSFNAKGATDGTTQAMLAKAADFASPAPIILQGDRSLYNAHLGVATPDANNSISAYIGNFYAAGNSTGRVLFDGVGYSVAGVNLTLEVDLNGDVRIVNSTPSDINIDYYEIKSSTGHLDSANWNTLSAQNVGAVDGSDPGSTAGDSSTEKWGVTGGSVGSDSILAEFYLPGYLTLASGESWVIGNPVLAGATLDSLSFRVGVQGYGMLDAQVALLGAPPAENGDFNGDGIVNLADYTVWRDNLGASGPGVAGDANGDDVVDAADYSVWKTQFGSTAGAASVLAGSASSAVPEPHTLVLAAAGLLAVSLLRGLRTLS